MNDPNAALPIPPLSPVELAVLVALAGGPSYGYGIVKTIASDSGGSIQMAPGNLYQVLDRLVSRDWVRALDPSELSDDADGRRRYYALTTEGRRAVAAETARLNAFMPTLEGLQRLLSRPGAP